MLLEFFWEDKVYYFKAVIEHVTRNRACLGQRLIAIRLPGICSNHVWSPTILITIISIACLMSFVVQTAIDPAHLSTVINCTVLHTTWLGGWELSQHQQPGVCYAGRSRGVWMHGAAAGCWRENWRVSYHQCSGGHTGSRQHTCSTWWHIILQLPSAVKVN